MASFGYYKATTEFQGSLLQKAYNYLIIKSIIICEYFKLYFGYQATRISNMYRVISNSWTYLMKINFEFFL